MRFKLWFTALQPWFCCPAPLNFANLMTNIWEIWRKWLFDTSWVPEQGVHFRQAVLRAGLQYLFAGVTSGKPHRQQGGWEKLRDHGIASSVRKFFSLGGCHGVRDVLQRISPLVWARIGILWWRRLLGGGERTLEEQYQAAAVTFETRNKQLLISLPWFAEFKHGYQEASEFSFT